jgi:hypothetical protein
LKILLLWLWALHFIQEFPPHLVQLQHNDCDHCSGSLFCPRCIQSDSTHLPSKYETWIFKKHNRFLVSKYVTTRKVWNPHLSCKKHCQVLKWDLRICFFGLTSEMTQEKNTAEPYWYLHLWISKSSWNWQLGWVLPKKWECEVEFCIFFNVLFQVSLTVDTSAFLPRPVHKQKEINRPQVIKIEYIKMSKSVHSNKGLRRSFCTYDKQRSNKAHFTGKNYLNRQKYEAETIDVSMSVHRGGGFTQSVLQ